MLVLEGKADAWVYDLPFNAVFAALHENKDLVFLDEPFTNEPLAWAIRKNDPDFLKFLNEFLKEFLKEIKADGRFDRIYKKWFENTDWFKYVR